MGNMMTKVNLLIWYPLLFYLLYCNGIKPMLIGTSKIMQRDNLLPVGFYHQREMVHISVFKRSTCMVCMQGNWSQLYISKFTSSHFAMIVSSCWTLYKEYKGWLAQQKIFSSVWAALMFGHNVIKILLLLWRIHADEHFWTWCFDCNVCIVRL